MPDEKTDNNPLAGLKTLADFEKANPPDSTPAPDTATPIAPVKATTEQLLAMNPKDVAKMFGIRESVDVVIDVPHRAEQDAYNAEFGDTDENGLQVANDLIDEFIVGFELEEEFGKADPAMRIAIFDRATEVLASPEERKEFLKWVDDPANAADVVKLIKNSSASNFIYRARQMEAGEHPTGRSRPKRDGSNY